jgi:signal peptidase II
MTKPKTVPMGRWVLFLSIAFGGMAFDLGTKAWIFRQIGPPGSPAHSVVADILELRTSHNPGALWGFARGWAGSSLFFAVLSIVAAMAIFVWLFFMGAAADLWLTIALALITAGALGNCYDRLAFGHVRDFVHFHVDSVGFDCAIFNFADNMLVLGAIGIILLALRPESLAAVQPVPDSLKGPAELELSAEPKTAV